VDKPVHRGRVTHELLLSIYKRFGKEGIDIPFPQTDVYLHRVAQDD
jgi:small-conductance mechanosensitive channel